MKQHFTPDPTDGGGQRLSLERLHRWEQLGYGMFIHFGMSTYDGRELSLGDLPSTSYNPTRLDVGQWVRVAAEAGMRYAVLTAKHVSGHCLWPSDETDYHVGTSGNTTDVVGAFVESCREYGLLPGLYYCSWDNHHLLGSRTPSMGEYPHATQAYIEFQLRQTRELLTRYGPLGEVWIDIPGLLGHEGRERQYDQIAELQPDALIMLNHGFGDGTKIRYDYAWPTDLMAIERWLPSSHRGYRPWHEVSYGGRTLQDLQDIKSQAEPPPPRDFYIPGEVCDPIGYEWFWDEADGLRSVEELLGMRLICRERGVNLLLNTPPNRDGVLPDATIQRVMDLREAYDRTVAAPLS